MRTRQTIAAVGALCASGLILAAPASAEPLAGPYNGTLIDGGGQVLNPKPVPLSFTPCGPDCTRMQTPSYTLDLHLQGATWTGSYPWSGAQCTTTIDAGSLVLDDRCPNEQPMRMSLVRGG
jgi:hypothetical protein